MSAVTTPCRAAGGRGSRSGAAALQYVLIASLISIAIVTGALLLRTALSDNYTTVSEQVAAATDF